MWKWFVVLTTWKCTGINVFMDWRCTGNDHHLLCVPGAARNVEIHELVCSSCCVRVSFLSVPQVRSLKCSAWDTFNDDCTIAGVCVLLLCLPACYIDDIADHWGQTKITRWSRSWRCERPYRHQLEDVLSYYIYIAVTTAGVLNYLQVIKINSSQHVLEIVLKRFSPCY